MTNIIKFDADLFDSLLDAASSASSGGGSKGGSSNKPRNTFVKHPGIKFSISNTPAGGFAFKIPNKKNVLVDKTARQIRGVIMDSKFALSQWGKEGDKPKMVCSSVANTLPGGGEGNGIWSIPFFGSRLTTIYNPQGFKGMSCADCIEQKLNEGCKQSGGIHILVTGIDEGKTNEDDDYIGIEDVEPFIAYVQTNGTGSGLEYSQYLGRLKSLPNKPAANTVETVFTTQPNPKAPVKMLKLEFARMFNNLPLAEKMYNEELQRMADADAKRFEEWKAKNPMTRSSKSSKSGDDDLPF